MRSRANFWQNITGQNKCGTNQEQEPLHHECAKLRGLRGSRGLEKLRGSWVVGRGTWVTLRGSWVNLRGSWVLFTDNFA